jgi:hypothetical protein
MNRRDFFKRTAVVAAGLVVGAELDVEKLLWVPKQKTYFLPSAHRALAASVQGLFSPSVDLAKQYREGMIGISTTYGFDWYKDSATLSRFTKDAVDAVVREMAARIDAEAQRLFWNSLQLATKDMPIVPFSKSRLCTSEGCF